MRIVIAVEGTRGDTHPMLALGDVLNAAGHEIRVCAPPDAEADVRAHGFDFVSLGQDVRRFLEEHAASLHTRGPRFFRDTSEWGDRAIELQFEVLPAATADADFVIAAGTVLAARSAAELNGVPFRYVLYTPAMLPSAEHSPALFPFQSKRPWVNRLAWSAASALAALTLGRRVNRFRRALGLSPVRDLIGHALSDRPLLAVDDVLAPGPVITRLPYAQIRCFHPFDPEPLPEKLDAFLAAGPKPVYFGFGSMPDPDPRRTTQMLLAVIERLGVRALISEGWAGLGEAALPPSVMPVGSVSHAALFPRVRAVVHHGGSGTTHTAARAGVPQLVIPHVLDQFYFDRRVQALGIGPPGIPRGRVTAERLEHTLRALLDNELLSERAAELGATLAALGPISPDPADILTG